MVKTFGIAFAVLLVVAVVAFAGVAYAQTSTPQAPGSGFGFGGMMGNSGGMMGRGFQSQAAQTGMGVLHNELIAAVAAKLGLSVDEINTRLTGGETLAQIALSKGIDATQFRTLVSDAHNAALDAAVKAGTLTQEQADWMKQRGQNMPMWGLDDSDGELDCPMYGGNGATGATTGTFGPGAMRGRMQGGRR